MKKWIFLLSVLIVILFTFFIVGYRLIFIDGYRLNAFSAAKNHSYLPRDAELIDKYNTGSSDIFIFKSDEEEIYKTVLTKKEGLFFRSSGSTYIPYSSDKIQMVGAISYTTENDAATLLSVISYDDEVAYIEAGLEPNIERKKIRKGERISFLFPFSKQIDLLNPTAFDKEGRKLYYYGYPKGTSILKREDYKWHKIGE